MTAFYAGLIVATSFGSIAMAHQALPDLPLAFFISLTVWGGFVGLLPDPPGTVPTNSRQAWLTVSAVGAAGAFLVKGPVGIALLLSVLLPLSLLEWIMFKRFWQVRPRDIVIATAIGLVLTVPWYLAMTMEHGVAYLERFFIAENLDRFATDRYNTPRAMWYYGPIVIGGLLPWSLFTPLCLQQLRERRITWRPDIATLRIGVWAIMPLIFYTFSIGKQPRYILPVLIPLSIFLAHGIVSALRDPVSKTRSFGICCVACGCVMFGIAALIYRAQPLLISTPPVILFTSTIALGLSGISITAAALAYIRTTARHWAQTAVALIATSVVVLNLAAHHGVLASNSQSEVQQMAAMIRAEQTNNEQYGRHRVFNRNLLYYVRSPHVELPVIRAVRDFLRSPERVLCVLREEDADLLARDGVVFRELGSLPYLNTGSLTLRMLFNPDPQRYINHVLLVSNR
jgi:4-amino-4-deoxy-L-arabinose transferase-like glycosyltransferase